jgi:hypothetical protein
MTIRDHLGVKTETRPEDMMDVPEFFARGGIVSGAGGVRRGCRSCWMN